jgi:hypothetical protein
MLGLEYKKHAVCVAVGSRFGMHTQYELSRPLGAEDSPQFWLMFIPLRPNSQQNLDVCNRSTGRGGVFVMQCFVTSGE